MENKADNNKSGKAETGFKSFAAKRIIVAAVIIIVVVWALGMGLDVFSRTKRPAAEMQVQQTQSAEEMPEHGLAEPETASESEDMHTAARQEGGEESSAAVTPMTGETADNSQPPTEHAAASESGDVEPQPHPESNPETGPKETAQAPASAPATAPAVETKAQERPTESHTPVAEAPAEQAVRPRGVAFVEAVIQPINYELRKRFWGWRPNDIVNLTDNTNNFQLGVLEVTRRTTIMLSDRISRTGSTDRLNPHLEDAANWLMVTATRYWFPSPESKYEECIKELEDYKQELIKGSASFYIRADNLIPLLASYEDLLGSCDENLVKQKEEDGSNVSFFKADNYFFYAKGVASAMATILEAIHYDFLPTLESRHGAELLHHALLSCRQASALSPLLITNAPLDGILANHRANMAAPISHARYYIGQLIKTLST